MKNILLATVIALATLAAEAAPTGTNTITGVDVRDEKNIGVMVGLGSPYPSIFGTTVAYYLNKDLRLTAGYGEIEMTTSLSFNNNSVTAKTIKATSYDLGGEMFFSDGNWRPYLGAHLASFQVSGDGEIDLMGFKKSTTHGYANVGYDYQGSGGYQFGIGYNVSLFGASGGSLLLNTGYYF